MGTTDIAYATTQSETGSGTAWTNPAKVLNAPNADPATVVLVAESQSKMFLLGGFQNNLRSGMRPSGLIITGTVGTTGTPGNDRWHTRIYSGGVWLGAEIDDDIDSAGGVQTISTGWGVPLNPGLAATIQIGVIVTAVVGGTISLEGVGIQWVWTDASDRSERIRYR